MSELLEEFLNSVPTGNNAKFNKVKFFSLKGDGDSEDVVILLHDLADMDKFSAIIHELKLTGADGNVHRNKINCLGDDCELCKHGQKKEFKIFIPIYNYRTQQVEIWERGVKQAKLIKSAIETYGDLTECDFRIIRHGKPQSKDTTYDIMFIPRKKDNKLPEGIEDKLPNIIGTDFKLVINLTPEQQVQTVTEGKLVFSDKIDETNEEEIPF